MEKNDTNTGVLNNRQLELKERIQNAIEKVGERFYYVQTGKAIGLSTMFHSLRDELINYLLEAKNLDEFKISYSIAHDYLIVNGNRVDGYMIFQRAFATILLMHQEGYFWDIFKKREGFLSPEIETYITEQIKGLNELIIESLDEPILK
ncbi:hypothetical protein [Marinifilum sp. D737]|uniref:hypothetical protein n=1 Tax=Marinifilum sp. D737 TaxID=2969628 RepID=UPI002274AAFB|nr:hypothetical protein [Marinifilum sp. D737]MCY1635058.1 hypothetical protein [Marinifilum sp. D737]